MIRKQQKRAARGKQTAFRVGGQEVDSKRIARFVRRYGTQWDSKPRDDHRQASPEPKTPSDMSCYTPEPDERGATLSPLPELQPNHREVAHPRYDETFDPMPEADLDDNRSLTATLSPSLPNETPKPLEPPLQEADAWSELVSFQDRLLVLHQTLEQTMSGFTSPHDE
ncbi:uncharacterized protein LDX57_007644 [Aspergillus melleus]|uniref:uncharacterized protein n=1 Tax=Aspergillus melleus TaxID=138277 RepID=UPI001E8D8C0D|nr:uncharacterized protein LDX57_007644 [Aspergillus melleus]KAH8429972.1 hypothetical protein LDX57_007644 [Aspergillus melleus]